MSDDEPTGRALRKSSRDFKTETPPETGFVFPISKSGNNERRVTVSRFKGKARVDIREYYTNEDGAVLPGRKGISLDADQWKKIMSFQELIGEALEELGK
jgi:hypothetical protein